MFQLFRTAENKITGNWIYNGWSLPLGGLGSAACLLEGLVLGQLLTTGVCGCTVKAITPL